MSNTAKKMFTNPNWVLFVGLFTLAGCQGTLTVDVEQEEPTSEETQSSGEQTESSDTTQETASTSEEDGSTSTTDDGSDVADSTDGTSDGTATTDSTDDTVTTASDGGSTDTLTDDSTDTTDETTEPVVVNQATLLWDAPAARENGDSLKVGEIDHYIVSWGTDPETLSNQAMVQCINCTDMQYVIQGLDEGTWYFTVQTRDTDGNVSRKADLASKQI